MHHHAARPRAVATLVVLALLLLGTGRSGFGTPPPPPPDEGDVAARYSHPTSLSYSAVADRSLLRLYLAYFGRTPDVEGFRYWQDQIEFGVPLGQVSQYFSTGAEFVNRYGHLDDARFVDLVYVNVLGRPPEPEGRAYWVRVLARGESRGEVMLGFSDSTEYMRRTEGHTPPSTRPRTGEEARGRRILGRLSYDWQARLPGWRIEFTGARSGYYGLTYPRERLIRIHVRSGQTDAHLAHVVAHEIGHAVDVMLNSTADRNRWRSARGLGSARWWPGAGVADFSTGAGDFAEVFAVWQAGPAVYQGRLAGRPDVADLRLVAELAAG